MFRTSTNSKDFKKNPEKNNGPVLVERSGYFTTRQRIQNLLNAGQQLADYRKQIYDFENGEIDENFTDPTRNSNFDLADATSINMELSDRLNDTKSEQVSETEDKLQTIPETAPETSEGTQEPS